MADNIPAKVNDDLATVENDARTTPPTDENKTEKTEVPAEELVHFDVTLSNGITLNLAALKNQEDWPMELLAHAQRGNDAVFLYGVLTQASVMKLARARAKTTDYETVSVALGEALGEIAPE